jgi:peptidoglycan/LPS O-acetylase OafA/YrhL
MRYRIINIAIALGVPLVASIPFAFLVWDDAYADPLSIYFFMFTGLIAIFGYFLAYVLNVAELGTVICVAIRIVTVLPFVVWTPSSAKSRNELILLNLVLAVLVTVSGVVLAFIGLQA